MTKPVRYTKTAIPNAFRVYIERLIDKQRRQVETGFVKVKNFSNSEKKTAYLYQLTPRGVREKALLTAKFLERKLQEFEDLKAEIARLEHDLGEELEARSD
jgi:hypothetical protein